MKDLCGHPSTGNKLACQLLVDDIKYYAKDRSNQTDILKERIEADFRENQPYATKNTSD